MTNTLFEDDNQTGKARSKKKAKAKGKASASASKPARRKSAESMATKQRDISVSEFFSKNRHLLGFDSPLKALLTTVKEAVDNSLDACEEGGILPEIAVEIEQTGEKTFKISIEDNGPGIVDTQIGKIFGKLLYTETMPFLWSSSSSGVNCDAAAARTSSASSVGAAAASCFRRASIEALRAA